MEKMNGGTLLHHIQRKGTFTEQEASLVTKNIATALLKLHSLGIAHRDLKPEVRANRQQRIWETVGLLFIEYFVPNLRLHVSRQALRSRSRQQAAPFEEEANAHARQRAKCARSYVAGNLSGF